METHLKSMGVNTPRTENCLVQRTMESDNIEYESKVKIRSSKCANDDPAEYAVIVRCANKSYNSGTQVLNELNMTVPCGSIYGLLGSSGCGKTTLLSCILGQRKLDSGSGSILIFGKKPEAGRNIGYMPQDISLYLEFSIMETFRYFGALSGLSKEEINMKTALLVKLLELPRTRTVVGTLSGGQQRRVSLAVSLLHNPKLLILDEPTVGLDPLIRNKIWLYLKNLVSSKRTTVILTTHYIQECRQADHIGILRNGRLLAERPPNDLFADYGTTNLEQIILTISKNYHFATLNAQQQFTQTTTKNQKSYWKIESTIEVETAHSSFCTFTTSVTQNCYSEIALMQETPKSTLKDSFIRIRALTRKNLAILLRSPLLLFFVILVTAVLIIITCTTLGREPTKLPIGLINNELNCSSISSNISKIPGECNIDNLSCHFLMNIPKESFQLKLFDNEEDALKSTQDGSTWGYIKFPDNFTEKLFERFVSGAFVDEFTINASQIYVRLDETSKHVSTTIKTVLYQSYEKFTKTFLSNCGIDPRQANSPLIYNQPIFGTHETDFREFLAAGGVPGLLFFFPIITTSIRYIKEKKSGVMDRSSVIGVQTWEIILSYSISEFFVLLIQSLINYLVLTKLFAINILGSDLLVILLYLLAAYGGVSMGFLLGSVCAEEIQAAMIGLVGFIPNLLLSGIIWPIEGMPPIFQKISQSFPCTLSAQALRSITSRGWEFTHPNVWPGFAIIVAYIIGCFILTNLYHKIVKK